MKVKGKKDKRTVTVKPETYDRLDTYCTKVAYEKRTMKVTFDDAVNSLLDLAESKGSPSA